MSTQLTESEWIWKDGEYLPWGDAKVHLLSLAVQFGSSIFEGIRCYQTTREPAVFRLDAHIRRLFDSCRVYRMLPNLSQNDVETACVETIRKNGLGDCYIRPMVLRGYGSAGLDPSASPVETYVATWPWGTYLGEGALEAGVDVCVSTWLRAHPDTFPVSAKAAGHYNSAQLIKMEAIANGYVEGIALGPGGLVSEGSGQNLFLVRDGTLSTPFIDGTSLSGITRDTVIVLAREVGIEVIEQHVPRETLYSADELFFVGTASEVTPIRSVDKIPIGEGKAGPVTLELQRRYLGVARGEIEVEHDWLTFVE
jgi:branched-chain amino acid aminotransferase